MTDQDKSADASAPAGNSGGMEPETRRAFVERLAKTATLPVVVPLMLSMSTAALA